MLTLGIETSCDETAVSITDGRKVLSNIVSSSVRMHKKYGGVVPEIASRFHVEYIIETLSAALAGSKRRLGDIGLIAVTNGPGLVGALLVGISLAKSLAYCLRVPLVGVNHVLAHLYSAFLNDEAERPGFPFVGLVASGGHTALFLCRDIASQRLLGQTQDDAVGEAFDKVAKILGLGYPGGPVIEKAAKSAAAENWIDFPKSYLGRDSLDFSFSGIKTAVLYYARDAGVMRPAGRTSCLAGSRQRRSRRRDTARSAQRKKTINDICFAFQEAALDVLVEKAVLACGMNKVKAVVIGGGVAANSVLRKKFSKAAALSGIKTYFPKVEYCMDNAAMVGMLGEALHKKGYRSDLYLTAEPNLEVN